MSDGIINAVHLLATAVWLGGAIFIHFILGPILRRIDPREAGKLQGILAPRFSKVAWACILLLIVTGLLKTPSDLLFDTTSDFGRILAVKHAMILAVVAVGLIIAFVVVPRLRKAAPSPGNPPSEEFHTAQRNLHTLAMTNTVLGVLIVLAAAFLW